MENFSLENLQQLWQRLEPVRKQQIIGLGTVVLVLIAVMVFVLVREDKSPIQIQKFEEAMVTSVLTESQRATSTPVKKIKVDIAGAVKLPGVYELPEESRLTNVIEEAGGISEEADQDYISKYINLSQIVSDADKIYIPKIGEESAESTFSSNANDYQSSSKTAGAKIVKKININTASQAQLETLPSIGPVYAQRVIEGRPYQKIEDILKIKGIGQKTFEKIKDLITIN